MYDVTIIGAGIVGCSIARELAKFNLKTIMVDKENDVANGTTKANSAIVHAGYDAKPGTLKALTNVQGHSLYEDLCKELNVPFKKTGSFVVALDDDDLVVLKKLEVQGRLNGVSDLEIIYKDQIKKMEPNLSERVIAALYAPKAGIVGPWELAIALAENAADNGVEILLNSPVIKIIRTNEGFVVKAGERLLKSKYVVNAAGLYSDKINELVNESYFKIRPARGEYSLFDKSVGDYVERVIFQAPSKMGKGLVVLPTVHGNMLIGPTSEYIEDPRDLKTTPNGLVFLREKAKKIVPKFPFGAVITSFTGLRSKEEGGDFIIEESPTKGFVNVAAIDSPGLTAAPAIAKMVVKILEEISGGFEENLDFNPIRRPSIHFIDMTNEEKAKLIESDPRFGRIICRCESITEGEIVDIIHRVPKATSLDAVKRRSRAGGGRCQGGFCGPRVMEILARELKQDIKSIVKDGKESYILTGQTKGGNHNEQV